MTNLEYSPVALEKLGAIHRYIAEELKNRSGADNTILNIRDQLRLLKTSPKLGAMLIGRFADIPKPWLSARYMVCGHYIAIYVFDEEAKAVRILRIYHASEDYVCHLFDV